MGVANGWHEGSGVYVWGGADQLRLEEENVDLVVARRGVPAATEFFIDNLLVSGCGRGVSGAWCGRGGRPAPLVWCVCVCGERGATSSPRRELHPPPAPDTPPPATTDPNFICNPSYIHQIHTHTNIYYIYIYIHIYIHTKESLSSSGEIPRVRTCPGHPAPTPCPSQTARHPISVGKRVLY